MVSKLLVDYDKIITNTKYSDKTIHKGEFVINFYNPDIDEPMQKYWLMLSNMKIKKIYDNSILFVLSSNEKKIINYFDKLDEIIEEKLNSISSKTIELPYSLITIDGHDPMIKVNFDENTKISNIRNESIKFHDLKKDKKVKLLIELEHIKIINKKYYQSWRIIMMKEEKDITLDFDIFDDKPVKKEIEYNSHNNLNPTINKNRPIHPLALALAGAKTKLTKNNSIKKNEEKKTTNTGGGISLDMLKSVKLRKTTPNLKDEKNELKDNIVSALYKLKKTDNYEKMEKRGINNKIMLLLNTAKYDLIKKEENIKYLKSVLNNLYKSSKSNKRMVLS